MSVQDYLESTEDLLNFAVTKLSAYEDWTVAKFPGTDIKKLFDYMPDLVLPAAVVAFEGAGFQNMPTRKVYLTVIVAVEFFGDNDPVTARTLMDKVAELLDEQVCGDAVFEIYTQDVDNFGAGNLIHKIEFIVSDH